MEVLLKYLINSGSPTSGRRAPLAGNALCKPPNNARASDSGAQVRVMKLKPNHYLCAMDATRVAL